WPAPEATSSGDPAMRAGSGKSELPGNRLQGSSGPGGALTIHAELGAQCQADPVASLQAWDACLADTSATAEADERARPAPSRTTISTAVVLIAFDLALRHHGNRPARLSESRRNRLNRHDPGRTTTG